MKKYVIAAGLLLCAGLIAFLALRSPAAFAGSRVKDPDSYTPDVRQMSGTDVHTLELRAGVVQNGGHGVPLRRGAGAQGPRHPGLRRGIV